MSSINYLAEDVAKAFNELLSAIEKQDVSVIAVDIKLKEYPTPRRTFVGSFFGVELHEVKV